MNGYDLIFVKKLKIDEMHDQLTWFIKNNTLNFVKKKMIIQFSNLQP